MDVIFAMFFMSNFLLLHYYVLDFILKIISNCIYSGSFEYAFNMIG